MLALLRRLRHAWQLSGSRSEPLYLPDDDDEN